MKTRTKYMLLGSGALLGLYWWSQRCNSSDIDAVAAAAVRGVAGMSSQAAAATLLRELPRQQPRMWASCRPELMRAIVKHGLSPATLAAMSAAAVGVAVDDMLAIPVNGGRTLVL